MIKKNSHSSDPSRDDPPHVETAVVDDSSAIADLQRSTVENFQLLGDWPERYQYLIELGRKLPAFPDAQRTETHRLHGCQANVWFFADQSQGRLFFHATSDAAIVSGLIALLLKVYSGHTPEAILSNPPIFIEEMGLKQHLSMSRATGLSAMVARIQALAAEAMASAQTE